MTLHSHSSAPNHPAKIGSYTPQVTEQPQITGLVTMDGTASMRLAQAVQSLNLAIPRDVSVVGLVANEVAELTTPTLTTINPLGYAIGYEAGKMLIDRLEGRISDTGQVLMPVQLIGRGSTGPVRASPSYAVADRRTQ